MHRKPSGLTIGLALAAVLIGNAAAANDDRVCGPLAGAIFTTDSGGNLVNGNIYFGKEDVYLSGGPRGNAPDHAAALPTGDQYFQVTDPLGKVLLSLAGIEKRQFHVNESGVIDSADYHPTRDDNDGIAHGAKVVQLARFADTPTESVTVRFGDSDQDEEIEVIFGNTRLGSISACKFYDYNANGFWDRDWPECEPPIPGVKFILAGRDIHGGSAGQFNVHRTLYTGRDGCVTFCGLYPGVYALTELTPASTASCNWWATTPTRIENIAVTCDSFDGFSHLFGNVITDVADFSSRSYWHKNGLAKISRCLETEGDLREELALQMLEFVFNVWQHLGGPTSIQTPEGTWASTSDIIAKAVAAANSLEAGAPKAQKELTALLKEINSSEAVIYILQEFSHCIPTEEY